MGERQTGRSPYKGIAILADGIKLDNLTDQGAGLTDSSYSQAGPRPGSAVASSALAKLNVEVSGAQVVPIDVRVVRAGLPGRVGVGVAWKRGEDNFGYRDLAPPNWVNHWVAAEWTDTLTWDLFDVVASAKTGSVVLLYARSGATTESVYARRFEFPSVDEDSNPQAAPTETAQWSAAVRASRNGSAPSVFGDLGQWRQVGGCALPSGQILCIASYETQQLRVYASGDGGATWAIRSIADVPDSFVGTATFARRRAVYYRGEIAVFDGAKSTATNTIAHVASSDLGSTFQHVDSPNTGYDRHAVTAIEDGGGIAFAYLRRADLLPAVRVLASAFQPIESATEVLIDPTVACDDIGLVSDAPGRLWAIGRLSTSDEVRVWGSADGGASWTRCAPGTSEGGLFLSHGAKIGNFAAAMCRGWCVVAHNWTAAVGNEDGSIGTLWSGGWGSIGCNPGSSGVGPIPATSRPGWGQTTPTGTSPAQSGVGVPIELPVDVGPWTNGGTVAPTLVPPGVVEFSLSAQTGWCELDPAGTAGVEHAALIEMWVATGSTGVGSLQAGFDLRVANGVASWRVEVRLGSSSGGFRVVDAAAASTIQDVTWDVTAPTQFVVAIDAAGHLVLGYRRPWHGRWRAVLLEGVSVLTDGGAGPTTNRIRFGATAAATATIHVRQWHHAEIYFGAGGSATKGALSFGFRATAGTDATGMTHRVGGLLSGSPTPLPEVGDQGLQEAFLAVSRGPGVLAEAYTIDPIYDHGIDRLFPAVSPSPGETWRTTDLAAQRITFDLGEDTRIGPIWHLLLGVFNANVKTVTLRGKTDAGGAFVTLGSYNGAQGFEGLTFERTGDWIRPAAGTATAGRWLDRNTLTGGIAILDTGGSPVALRIDASGPGRWVDPSATNTLLPELRLVGVSGATPASGLCDLVFPAGVRPIRFTATNPPTEYLRYLQVVIPVQVVPEAYYEIGTLFLGTTAIFGKRWSRGWTRSMLPNTARRVSRYGVIRKRRDGPPAMRWSLAWPDGVRRNSLLSSASPDYIGVGGSGHADVPVAAVDDVLGTLLALLEETEGTERPVVALDSIPDGASGGATINDRLRFLYGTLDGNAQYNNVAGRDERSDDFGRIDPIAISELVK
jgi:hypothetical protein